MDKSGPQDLKGALKHAEQRARRHAPYLAQLLSEHDDVLGALALADPNTVLEACLTQMSQLAQSDDPEAIMPLMRALKRRAHLLIALCDLARIWDWAQACHALTRLADSAVHAALACAARYRGIPLDANNRPSGLFVMALGKYGAYELNYSSDIDIVLLYDPQRIDLGDGGGAEKRLLRLAQSFVKILDEQNAHGYVFRTDLRLRPDPRSNAIIISTQTAERYYEVLGQNWERAAMIKARICGGDLDCGQDFIESVLQPFIWRRSLDFAAIDDIRAMKRQINSTGGHSAINPAGHNLKLGRGGIREIEFYAQTQQLILGGRHKELRATGTIEALGVLAEGGYVAPQIAQDLITDYALLRDLEHRAQMRHDAQTHIAPTEPEARRSLAALYGYDDLAEFDAMLTDVLSRVNDIYAALYAEDISLASKQGSLVFTGVEPDPDTRLTLERLGYGRIDEVWAIMAAWLGGRITATRTERARETLTRLAPALIEACAATGRADDAFFRFDAFFSKMRSGVSLLLMFESQPDMLRDLISMLVLAPRLSEVLSASPDTIESLIEPSFWRDSAALDRAALLGAGDLEQVMNAARRSVKEAHFRISAKALRGAITARQAAKRFTAIADSAVQVLCTAVCADLMPRFGAMPGGVCVLAMGKMGGAEMSVSSDLDMMVIYDPRGHDSAKAHIYFTKFTQRLISALSSPTEAGLLYEVDMALRPSGKKGPITVSLQAFETYYAHEAWTWEFLALTRARMSYVSDPAMAQVLGGQIRTALTHLRAPQTAREDICKMRDLMDRERLPSNDWDIKLQKGGLVDIEFIVQGLQILNGGDYPQLLTPGTRDGLDALWAAELIDQKDHKLLTETLTLYETVLQYKAICLSGQLHPDVAPASVLSLIAQRCGFENFVDLEGDYHRRRAKIRPLFNALICEF